MAECDVCNGMGRYPVINRYGQELYTIACPECGGCGEEYDPDQSRIRAMQNAYEAVMNEQRRRVP